eukprot:scpid61998/ scgid2092/ LIM domain-binding protein 2; Carboxyl-terminal LIM domain-binding protein 1; LIM domain-binding factor CLIM1
MSAVSGRHNAKNDKMAPPSSGLKRNASPAAVVAPPPNHPHQNHHHQQQQRQQQQMWYSNSSPLPPMSSAATLLADLNRWLAAFSCRNDSGIQYFHAMVSRFFDPTASISVTLARFPAPAYNVTYSVLAHFFVSIFIKPKVRCVQFLGLDSVERSHETHVEVCCKQASISITTNTPNAKVDCNCEWKIDIVPTAAGFRICNWDILILDPDEYLHMQSQALHTSPITENGLIRECLKFLKTSQVLQPMRELMAMHRESKLSPRECLENWAKMSGDTAKPGPTQHSATHVAAAPILAAAVTSSASDKKSSPISTTSTPTTSTTTTASTDKPSTSTTTTTTTTTTGTGKRKKRTQSSSAAAKKASAAAQAAQASAASAAAAAAAAASVTASPTATATVTSASAATVAAMTSATATSPDTTCLPGQSTTTALAGTAGTGGGVASSSSQYPSHATGTQFSSNVTGQANLATAGSATQAGGGSGTLGRLSQSDFSRAGSPKVMSDAFSKKEQLTIVRVENPHPDPKVMSDAFNKKDHLASTIVRVDNLHPEPGILATQHESEQYLQQQHQQLSQGAGQFDSEMAVPQL